MSDSDCINMEALANHCQGLTLDEVGGPIVSSEAVETDTKHCEVNADDVMLQQSADEVKAEKTVKSDDCSCDVDGITVQQNLIFVQAELDDLGQNGCCIQGDIIAPNGQHEHDGFGEEDSNATLYFVNEVPSEVLRETTNSTRLPEYVATFEYEQEVDGNGETNNTVAIDDKSTCIKETYSLNVVSDSDNDSDLENDHSQIAQIEMACGGYLAAISGQNMNIHSTEELVRIVEGECSGFNTVSKFPVEDQFYQQNDVSTVHDVTLESMERVVIGMGQSMNVSLGNKERSPTLSPDLDDTLKEISPEVAEDEDSDLDEDAATSNASVYQQDSEMISFRIPDRRVSFPLCSSTPVGHSFRKPLHRDFNEVGHCENEYPVLSTFKPVQNECDNANRRCKAESTSSLPLCSSTPLVKKTRGLSLRDVNIVDEEDHQKKHAKDLVAFSPGLSAIVEDSEEFVNKHGQKCREQKKSRKNLMENEFISNEIILKRDRDSKREKRRMKGTRIKKYKEYIGPGLTSDLVITDQNKENVSYVKNTDIETCTLTEYQGFGLTGPLPAKSTVFMPTKGLCLRDTNTPQVRTSQQSLKLPESQVVGVDKCNELPCDQMQKQTSCKSLKTCISGSSLGQRPAGTEGMILSGCGKNRSETACTAASQSTKIVAHAPNIEKCTSGHATSTGSLQPHLSSQQSGKLHHLPSCQSELPASGHFTSSLPLMSTHLAQFSSGTSSALQPDDVYPCLSSSSKGDKSDSNTDKSGHSDRQIDPKVLQCNGQLKLSAYMNFGLVTVHIIQGRQLNTKWKSACDSFVKMTLVPDDGKKPKCKTAIVQDSNNPVFDEKFSFELNEEDHNKRLMVSVWHRDQDASVNEFLGCMSFGIRHLTNPKKEVSGWYYLLTEDIGRKKHLKVSHRNNIPQLKIRNHSNIPAVNKDVWGTETLKLTLHRGKNGFGFSVVEACPVRVGRVDGASPAESAGLQQGDIIIRLNKQNVSRSTTNSVAKLVKHSSNTLLIEVQRPKPITYEVIGDSPDMSQDEHGRYSDDMITNDNEKDHTVPQMFTLLSDDKENVVPGEESLYPLHPSLTSLATSTPLPLLVRGHRTVQTYEMRKQEAIHRLLSLELEYIDVMHAGMQRYSRPLRHCILSHSQHTAVFQNIEKLTTISEYHVKQMHDNAPSFVSEDTDTSASSDSHSFVRSIGLIYQSKVHMLCQAYDLYAQGIAGANQVLSDLRCNEDFQRFIQETPIAGNQPSITSFIYQPVDHVRELYRAIQDVFLNTSRDAQDYNSLKEVVEALQECVNNITNYSCVRVGSVSSLASRDSKVSFSGSMRSRSSTSSASSSKKGQGHSTGTSSSLHSSKSVDAEVLKIQDQLVFPSNVPVFQLCQDERHVIFSGDLYQWEGRQWVKIHAFLFTDLILQTIKEMDGSLRVLQEPTMLQDITGMDAQRQHGTEFILFCGTSSACNPAVQNSSRSKTKKLHLRAPSTEQKYAWKSLVEQRVFAVRGSLEYYSSCSDVSSSSASAVII